MDKPVSDIAKLEAEVKSLLGHFGHMKQVDASAVLNNVAAELRQAAAAPGATAMSVAKAASVMKASTAKASIVPSLAKEPEAADHMKKAAEDVGDHRKDAGFGKTEGFVGKDVTDLDIKAKSNIDNEVAKLA